MKFEAWPVEPPGLGSGPLSIRIVGLAEPGQVVGDAVADDPGADDHDALTSGQRPGFGGGHGTDISDAGQVRIDEVAASYRVQPRTSPPLGSRLAQDV